MEVYLAGEFFDVDNFFVQTTEDHAAVTRLTEDMTAMYKKDEASTRINPKTRPMIGSPVAVFDQDSNTWLRAEVIDAHYNTVTIEFVDYGTIMENVELTPTNIRWLHPKYLLLPRKCIKVGLYGVSAKSAAKESFYTFHNRVSSHIKS